MRKFLKNIFFFDLDGTIWNQDCSIPESTVTALHELHKRGHYLFICTGRTKGFLNVPALQQLPFDGGIYGCGTHIEYGDYRSETILPAKMINRILDGCRIYGLLPILEGPEYMYLDPELLKGKSIQKITLQYRHTAKVSTEKTDSMTVQKASCIYTQKSDCKNFNAGISADFKVIEHDQLSEIVPQGFSKASGMQRVLELLHMDKSCSFAFGDSKNDLEMLTHAGCGIAMGNSPAAVKQAADSVTDDIGHNGIYNALKKLSCI